MRVSIVTPSLNQAPFLQATIDSVLAQNWPDLEYWVIDGGSTDGTVDLLRRQDARVQWVSESDRGQSHAINKGIARTHGDVFTYLNGDDVLALGAIATAVAAFESYPDAAVVYGECGLIDAHGNNTGTYDTQHVDSWDVLTSCIPFTQPAAFMRRSALDRIGPVREDLHYSMDYDLWLRLAKEGAFVHVETQLAAARVHAGAKTVRNKPASIGEVVHYLYKEYGSVPPAWIDRWVRVRTRTLPPGLRELARLCRGPWSRALHRRYRSDNPAGLPMGGLPHATMQAGPHPESAE